MNAVQESPSIRKVSFGTIAKKDTTSKTKTEYPVFDDPNGQAAILAARIKARTDEFEALKGALEVDKAELKQLIGPFYFTHNHGKAEVPSSIAVRFVPNGSETEDELLVTFPNKYPKLSDESALKPILGEHLGRCFRQSFGFEIDGDKLPDEQLDEFVRDLHDLFAQYNATKALTVKDNIVPMQDFHTLRHTLLTPEQNLALEQACPIQAMVKTKGRKK